MDHAQRDALQQRAEALGYPRITLTSTARPAHAHDGVRVYVGEADWHRLLNARRYLTADDIASIEHQLAEASVNDDANGAVDEHASTNDEPVE